MIDYEIVIIIKVIIIIIIDYETTLGEWKILLTMAINFVSSKDDSDEIRTMHTKSDSIEIIETA